VVDKTSGQMIENTNLGAVAAEVYRSSKVVVTPGGEPFSRNARKLLFGLRPLKEPVTGPEAGKKGVDRCHRRGDDTTRREKGQKRTLFHIRAL
jgi:hypothetical protein